MQFTFRPVTKDNLADLDRFSQAHGKFRYCSCMRWRLRSSEFQKSSKEARIAMLEQRVREGVPVGVLAYVDEVPVSWCSIAPRETYAALSVSRTLPPIDEVPVWSVTCFFIDSKYRRQGLTGELLKAAVDYALSHGALAIEGYPVPADSVSYTYMGTPATYHRAGFKDVTPPGQKRQVMRYIP